MSSNYFLNASDSKEETEGAFTIYRVMGDKNKAITIDINVCGTPQTMELKYTEASKTVLIHESSHAYEVA